MQFDFNAKKWTIVQLNNFVLNEMKEILVN